MKQNVVNDTLIITTAFDVGPQQRSTA